MSAPETLWDDYIGRARAERDRKHNGRSVVSRDELTAELTPLGYLRWYMHPAIPDVVDQALYFAELEIPAGSRSGKLFHQGGIVHLVVEGHGHTVLDGQEHAWESFDVIAIPARLDGVSIQHFNDGPGPVRMVLTFPNYDSALGPELGVAMDVPEPCPEYTP